MGTGKHVCFAFCCVAFQVVFSKHLQNERTNEQTRKVESAHKPAWRYGCILETRGRLQNPRSLTFLFLFFIWREGCIHACPREESLGLASLQANKLASDSHVLTGAVSLLKYTGSVTHRPRHEPGRRHQFPRLLPPHPTRSPRRRNDGDGLDRRGDRRGLPGAGDLSLS